MVGWPDRNDRATPPTHHSTIGKRRERTGMRYHMADEVLREFAGNRVDPETAGRVRAHLDTGCERCAAEVRFWCRSMAGLQLRSEAGASEAGLQRAFALF